MVDARIVLRRAHVDRLGDPRDWQYCADSRIGSTRCVAVRVALGHDRRGSGIGVRLELASSDLKAERLYAPLRERRGQTLL
jgi:hypothetical protein